MTTTSMIKNTFMATIAKQWLTANIISQQEFAKLLEKSTVSSASVHPYVSIIDNKLVNKKTGKPITMEFLTQWVAKTNKLDYLKIDPTNINVNQVTQVISQAYARQHQILPVYVDSDEIVIAVADPKNTSWLADIQKIHRQTIRRVHANPIDIQRLLFEFYGVNKQVQSAKRLHKNKSSDPILNLEQLVKLGTKKDINADDQHVIGLVDWLLQYAFDQRASDIHLEPKRENCLIRFRIDGKLLKVYDLPPAVMAAVTSRIKILSRIDVAEKRRPQDGRIKTLSQGNREIELRVSTMPTTFGEKCVMRIFDPDAVVVNYEDLGFSEGEADNWRRLINRPNGIVLVTGPTGSGKTTTLYSTLKKLATPDVNVSTVEDPIEMVDPILNQMQVNPKIGLHFADGVRTLMRQDPDIIMIGEIRDLETAQMAVQASLTGHLVLSTLHTNDAPSSINRLLDLGVADYLLRSTLAGVLAQRLIRLLCPHCKKPTKVDAERWVSMVHPFDISPPKELFEAVGCDECRNTGYHGRSGVFEMMPIHNDIRKLIRDDVPSEKLAAAAYQQGMMPLRISISHLLKAGKTSLEEAIRLAPPDAH
ncbi:GspE/PulE family protein [Marinicella sp. S1101]|uniref:GspE/PulE family protein n=1 Tax=Marinicella marina TaxID=2996016 RepID=UPI002260FF60|nr:GspE/PulE family protein [Marinicella marina]MCX7552316.1 GspE/PulE family protein [Marinicella marina]MDJ1139191.1 GspE/PulE family protein [Marinicella marina]